jgi:hypothetical protein
MRPQPHVIYQRAITVLPGGRLTRRDAAAFLDREIWTLDRWAAAGIGPPVYKVGNRCYYLLTDLDAFIASGGKAA